MFKGEIEVRLKEGVDDPEGKNTLKTLNLLGFSEVRAVCTSRKFEILLEGRSMKEVRERLEKICQRLLANPVIHEYEIKVSKQ
ncbi:MAG TPA: phosphoribosylformylglycinamidine synthase subunit PurS [Thermoplasmata archaeon]|nr:phosphoribosylformylglycinamidine synthase subunit PurS [Thermoplasmata archaeon]HIH98818.1 phosphoribosylformylglycinamidine synthase subunit PurS [Thermoplasmata archaeon]